MYNPFDTQATTSPSARLVFRRRLTPAYNEPRTLPRLVNSFLPPRRAPVNSSEWTRLSARNRDFNDCFNCGTRLGAVPPKCFPLPRPRGIDNSPVRVEANEIVDVGNPLSLSLSLSGSPLHQLEIEVRYTCTAVMIRSLGGRRFYRGHLARFIRSIESGPALNRNGCYTARNRLDEHTHTVHQFSIAA